LLHASQSHMLSLPRCSAFCMGTKVGGWEGGGGQLEARGASDGCSCKGLKRTEGRGFLLHRQLPATHREVVKQVLEGGGMGRNLHRNVQKGVEVVGAVAAHLAPAP
jgi:hypothetical protein